VTLARVLETPTRRDIPWADIEGLLDALSAILKGKGGSRLGAKLGGHNAVFHRPHPRPTTDKGTWTFAPSRATSQRYRARSERRASSTNFAAGSGRYR
jgi:hypothetical protein